MHGRVRYEHRQWVPSHLTAVRKRVVVHVDPLVEEDPAWAKIRADLAWKAASKVKWTRYVPTNAMNLPHPLEQVGLKAL